MGDIYSVGVGNKPYVKFAEDIAKIMCKALPNEFISVPEDMRLDDYNSLNSVFGEREENTYTKGRKGKKMGFDLQASLDAKRWGPLFNPENFRYFLKGLKGFIDDVTLVHLYIFFEELLDNCKVFVRANSINLA